MEFFPWSRKFLDAKNTVRRILHERILKTIHFILSPRKILLLKAWRKMNVRLNGCVCWFFPCGTTTKKWNGDRNQLMKTVLKLRAFYHENPILTHQDICHILCSTIPKRHYKCRFPCLIFFFCIGKRHFSFLKGKKSIG